MGVCVAYECVLGDRNRAASVGSRLIGPPNFDFVIEVRVDVGIKYRGPCGLSQKKSDRALPGQAHFYFGNRSIKRLEGIGIGSIDRIGGCMRVNGSTVLELLGAPDARALGCDDEMLGSIRRRRGGGFDSSCRTPSLVPVLADEPPDTAQFIQASGISHRPNYTTTNTAQAQQTTRRPRQPPARLQPAPAAL